jgi:carbamoylphosphate synthase small subunit
LGLLKVTNKKYSDKIDNTRYSKDLKHQTGSPETSGQALKPFFYLRSNMTEKILILDFGSQYTQLIARAVREANVYCEIIPFHKSFEYEPGLKGIILSGSPFSVNEEKAPDVKVQEFIKKIPVLGICYGAQLTAKHFGGVVAKRRCVV